MRNPIRLSLPAALIGVILLLSALSAHAGPPSKRRRSAGRTRTVASIPRNVDSGIEKYLLGIRVLQSYSTVLNRLGQPTKIFRGDQVLLFSYKTNSAGKYDGGVQDVTAQDREDNGAGTAGTSATPASSGGDSGSGDEGGLPGDGGSDPSGSSPGGAPASGGLSGSNQEKKLKTFAQSGGFVWVYLYPREEKAYVFYFNHDGRALLLIERGLGLGSPTSRGINLGSPVKEVYQKYGWPDSVEETDNMFHMFYDVKHHLQVDVHDKKVVGVVVMLTEGLKVRELKGDGSGGGNGSSGGGTGPGGKGSVRGGTVGADR